MRPINAEPAHSVQDPGTMIVGGAVRRDSSYVQDMTADEALMIALGVGGNRSVNADLAATAPSTVQDLSN